MSLCSWFTKRTTASPLRRPCALKHRATPPLQRTRNNDNNSNTLYTFYACATSELGSHTLFFVFSLLGYVETTEKLCYVLIGRLPRKTSSSDHAIVVYFFIFPTVKQNEQRVNTRPVAAHIGFSTSDTRIIIIYSRGTRDFWNR